MPTTPGGIWFPGPSDPVTPISTVLQTISNSVDANLGVPLFSTTAARDAQFAVKPFKECVVGASLDAGTWYVRTNGVWYALHPDGLNDILSTSAGAQVHTGGASMASDTSASEVGCTTVETLSGMTQSGGRMQVPSAGWYMVQLLMSWSLNANGNRAIYFGLNGSAESSRLLSILPAASSNHWMTISGVLHLSAGDSISVFGWQNSGSTLTINRARIAAASVPQQG